MARPLVLIVGCMDYADTSDTMFAFDAARWVKVCIARGVPERDIKVFGKVKY
jgi:hypothetical protein